MSAHLIAPSRRTRRTPFSSQIEALGARAYTVYNHMLLATSFQGVEADYWHLRHHVQLWDVSCERQVEVTGPDAAKLVQMMTPRSLQKAVIGQCVYAPIIDAAGGMINDPVILKLAEDRFWISIADSDVKLYTQGLAQGLGMDVSVSEPDVFPLAIQGPKADDLAARVFGDEVRDIRFFRFRKLAFKGHEFVVARSGWSKQGGFEIYVDAPNLAGALWDTLWQAGQDFSVAPGCPNLIERIEGGLFSYGNDFTQANNPIEAGLEKYCAIDSDIDFIGKEALRRIRDEGPARMIRGVRLEGSDCPACVESWPVDLDGRPVGMVTSAAWSPALGTAIGFAMIDAGAFDIGTELQVQTPDGPRAAVVCDIPFDVPGIES